MSFIFFSSVLIFFIVMVFLILSKNFLWENISKSTFECGFTSYFFSRFSFSIHYFLIALTFLILDLELCFLLPFFNEDSISFKSSVFMLGFILILLMGLVYEWKKGFLDWKN